MASDPQFLTGKAQELSAFLDKFDTFLFDCDGVLWSGDKLFHGVVETLQMLKEKGCRIVFVTNNSAKSRADYRAKLNKMGIPAETDDIFPSCYSAAVYISRVMDLPPNRRKGFVIGQGGVEQELDSEGIKYLGGTDRNYKRKLTLDEYERIGADDDSILDPEVGFVLIGGDDEINYMKLSLAYHYIRRGAAFLATNMDATYPIYGTVFPGAGTNSAPIIKMLNGREPISLGKPSQAMMDAIEGKFQLDRTRTCMIGDRMETDIRFGIEGKLGGTLAVLTGVSSEKEVLEGASKPSHYVTQISDLLLAKDANKA